MNVDKKFRGLLDMKSACKKFNKSESTLKTLINRGKFKVGVDCVKFGNVWVFNEDELEKYYKKLNEK